MNANKHRSALVSVHPRLKIVAWSIVTLFTLAPYTSAQATLQPSAQVEFIVADLGAPLKRVSVDKCYEFWESEVRRHLLNPHTKVDRSRLTDEYGYLASEWSGDFEVPIVLLEKIH